MSELIEVLPSDVKIGDWQARKDIGESPLLELSKSIEANGLLQPIVLLAVKPNDFNTKRSYYLIAGERRLKAWELLRNNSPIKGIIYKEISEREFSEHSLKLDVYLSSLSENIDRVQLNFIELADSILKLSEEFQLPYLEVSNKLFGNRYSGDAAKNTIQQYKKIAKLEEASKKEIADYIISCRELKDSENESKFEFTRTHALQVARTGKLDVQLLAIKFAIENRASIKVLSAFMDKQTDNRGNKSSSEHIDWSTKESQLTELFAPSSFSEQMSIKVTGSDELEGVQSRVTFEFKSEEELTRFASLLGDVAHE